MLREAGLQGMAKLCSLEGNPTLHIEGAHCPCCTHKVLTAHAAHTRCSLPHAAHTRCSLTAHAAHTRCLLPPPCTQKVLTAPHCTQKVFTAPCCTQKVLTAPTLHTEDSHHPCSVHRKCSQWLHSTQKVLTEPHPGRLHCDSLQGSPWDWAPSCPSSK
jgi:hypothetical protein